jgi:hypothetical protein
MAQWATVIRNMWIASVETTVGPSPIMKIRTGSPPVSCEAADTGTVLSTVNVPADWLSAPTSGAASKLGVWEDIDIDADGTAGHFRLYSAGGTCYLQGTVGLAGTDMTVSSIAFAAGDQFTVGSLIATSVGQ